MDPATRHSEESAVVGMATGLGREIEEVDHVLAASVAAAAGQRAVYKAVDDAAEERA